MKPDIDQQQRTTIEVLNLTDDDLRYDRSEGCANSLGTLGTRDLAGDLLIEVLEECERLVPLVRLGRRLFSLEGLTIIAGGTAYAALEDEPTAWDGIWWAVSTMTTVGYGDQFPETAEGRVLAMAVMLVGIGTLTMLIGAASERFLRPDIAGEAEEVEQELDATGEALLGELRAVPVGPARGNGTALRHPG